MAKQFWSRIREQIAAGNPPKVFLTRAGKFALDGSAAEMPEAVATLLPVDIRDAAVAVAEERARQQQAESDRRRKQAEEAQAKRQAVIDEYGNRRVWRLTGLYVDDVSTARYTWAEIAAWLDWDACNLRHRHASIYAVCGRGEQGDFAIDLSPHFYPCDQCGRTPSFATICERLRDYVQVRRLNAAKGN